MVCKGPIFSLIPDKSWYNLDLLSTWLILATSVHSTSSREKSTNMWGKTILNADVRSRPIVTAKIVDAETG